MKESESLRQAIKAIWSDLPQLLGDKWQSFAYTLQCLLDQFTTADDATGQIICDKIFDHFYGHSAANARLHDTLIESVQQANNTRGGAIASSKGATAAGGDVSSSTIVTGNGNRIGQIETGGGACIGGNASVESNFVKGDKFTKSFTVTRYTDIACPQRVWVETPRITVVVRLTAQPSTYSVATEEFEVRTDLPVQVRLDAPTFQLLNAAHQATTVPAAGDTPPLVFDLAPTTVGHTTLVFDFLQGGNPLRTVTVPIEVTAQPVEEGVADRSGAALALRTENTPPDLLLHIAWHEQSKELEFTLIREGGAWWRTFSPVPLSGAPAAHAAALYQKITTLVHQDDPTLQAIFHQRRQLPAADVDRRIKQLGQNLWADLIPDELKELYLAERETWQGRTLLLWCDEPYIPWELVWPYDKTDEDEGPWCATLRLTRWLRRDARGNGNEGAPTGLALQSLAILAPTYALLSNLAFAQNERQQLAGLIQQHQLHDSSPAQPTWGAVMDLLDAGGYQWLHVAAHGNFYPQAPDGDSALWLAADTAFTPDAMIGPAIERHLHTARPGFFFNACEVGRQGWTLTRLGGWANRLISAGAGLFIGPHWEVRDDSALTFAHIFYQHLLQGATIAEATYQARRAARQTGDPTWLAYSVYAHPNARIVAA